MVEASGKKERYEVLYEEIGAKVQLVLEGHSTLDQKIERVDAKIDLSTHEISRKLEMGFATVMKEIRQLQERFDTHGRAHTSYTTHPSRDFLRVRCPTSACAD